MRSLLREPLLHFLVIGAGLFAGYSAVNRSSGTQPGEVVVSAGEIEHLSETFTRFQQRPPTAEELKGLIDQYVREEILSRAAVALGLDQNDSVIRRRLQQKMEFVATDLATADEPTDDELAAWWSSHPDHFRRPPRFSFRHVYLNPDRHGDRLDADVSTLLANLKEAGATADASAMGDSFLLPHEFADEPQDAVAAQFGSEFATRLDQLTTGAWSGPIRSGYGTHLVLLTARVDDRLPALSEVRDLVRQELMSERRLEANRRFLDDLFAKYKVTIEWPSTTPDCTDQTLARMP